MLKPYMLQYQATLFPAFETTFNSNCERNTTFKQLSPVHKDLYGNQQLITDIE